MTTLDHAMLESLQVIATPEEIDTLVILLDGLSHGRVEAWYADFLCEIIKRLAESASTATSYNHMRSNTQPPLQ